MRHGRSIAVVLGVAAALTLAAPGGAAVKTAASDRAILRAGVLTKADVPATWTGMKQSEVATKNYQGLAPCKQIAVALATGRRTPHALSPRFLDPTPTSNSLASNEVVAFKTVVAAQRYLAAFEASNASTCFMQAFNRATTGFQATVTPITGLQGVGNEAAGYEASITGTDQNGAPVNVIGDVVTARVGRAVVGFNFGNNAVRLPQAESIVQATVGRLTALRP
jgi:hypothetical protein